MSMRGRHHLRHRGAGQREDAQEHVPLRRPGIARAVGRDPCPRPRVGPAGQPEEGPERRQRRRRPAPRRAGQLRRDRADDPGQQVAHDPHQADGRHQPDEPAGGRAGPPGDGRARCRAGEHQERQVRHVKVTGEGAARSLGQVVAAERAWQIGVGFGRQGEPGGPQREGRRHAGAPGRAAGRRSRQRSDVAFLSAPHGRAGAALTLGMGSAEGVERAVDHESDQLLPQRHTLRAFASRAATQGQT